MLWIIPLVVFGIGRCIAQNAPSKTTSPSISVNWHRGPGIGDLRDLATIQIPEGLLFADAKGATSLLLTMGNPISGRETGVIAPENGEWLIVFEFQEAGYVSRDQIQNISTEALMMAVEAENNELNRQRKNRGWPEFAIDHWQARPRFDPEMNALAWAFIGRTGGNPVFCQNIRLFARNGFMSASWVGPKRPESAQEFKQVLARFSFKSGKQYADFNPGDPVVSRQLEQVLLGISAPELKTKSPSAPPGNEPDPKGNDRAITDRMIYAISLGILFLAVSLISLARVILRGLFVRKPALLSSFFPRLIRRVLLVAPPSRLEIFEYRQRAGCAKPLDAQEKVFR